MKNIQFKKLRLWLAYPFAALYFVFAYKNGINFDFGIWFIISGLLIRLWAAGFIKKRRELTVLGPYAFVRNPLYLGNFLAGLGFCLFVKSVFLFLIYIGLFYVLYLGTIKEEEILLSNLFGQDYLNYKKSVPAVIPSFKKYALRQDIPYSLRQADKNGEFIRILVTGILFFSLDIFRYFFNKDKYDGINISKVIVMAILVILLAVNIIHRKNYDRRESKVK